MKMLIVFGMILSSSSFASNLVGDYEIVKRSASIQVEDNQKIAACPEQISVLESENQILMLNSLNGIQLRKWSIASANFCKEAYRGGKNTETCHSSTNSSVSRTFKYSEEVNPLIGAGRDKQSLRLEGLKLTYRESEIRTHLNAYGYIKCVYKKI